MLDRFLGTLEVRKYAGDISRPTLWRWVRDGYFPAPEKIGPNKNGWRESRLKKWGESRKIASELEN